MRIPERLRKWRSREAEKLRTMSLKQKFGYIFTYYKSWLLGLLLLAMAAGYVADAVVQSHRDIVLQGFFTNDQYNFFPAGKLQDEYTEYLALSRSQRVVFDDVLFIDLEGNADEYSAASNGKLIAYMAVAELDFVVTSREVLEYYMPQLPMADLQSLLPADLYERLSGELHFAEGAAVALDMAQSRYMRGSEYAEAGSYYLFVPYNAPNTDRICEFIDYIFQ